MDIAACPHCQVSFDAPLASTSSCPSCKQALAADVLDRTVVNPKRAARQSPGPKPEAAPGPKPEAAPGPKPVAAPGPKPVAAPKSKPIATPTPPPQQPVDPLLTKVLGGCKLEEMIGRGAMGSVYRATQINLDRTVAIKTIRPEYVADENVLKRFQQEAKTVGRFSTPHVVQIHQVGYQEGTHFIVMEYVHGGTLSEYVSSQVLQRLTTDDAIRYLRESCLGLQEAQAAGVLHRDIKPDNLLLSTRGVLKIADFGIAKVLESDMQMTMTSELTGTPMYMSPEQCRAETLDFRTDMFSLGASFYYLITGQPPAKGSSMLELIQTKTRIKSLSVERAMPDIKVSGPLSRIIERMTALAPADRYADYADLIADLDLAEQGLASAAAQPRQDLTQRMRRPTASPKKSKAGLLIGAAVVAALGGAGWFFAPEIGAMFGPDEVAETASSTGESQGHKATAATGQSEVGIQEASHSGDKEQNGGATVIIPLVTTSGDGAEFDIGGDGTKAGTAENAKTEAGTPTSAPSEEDYRSRLAQLRVEFLELGPTGGILTDAEHVQNSIPDSMAVKREAKALVTEIGAAANVRTSLNNLISPKDPKPPFTDLDNYVTDVEEKTDVSDKPGEVLEKWSLTQRELRTTKNSNLSTLAIQALKTSWDGCKATTANSVHSTAELDSVLEQLKDIRRGQSLLHRLFQQHKVEIDAAAPLSELDGFEQACKDRGVALSLIVNLSELMRSTKAVTTYQDWTREHKVFEQNADSLAAQINKLTTTRADTTELTNASRTINDKLTSWTRIAKGIEEALSNFGDHRLDLVERKLEDLADEADFKAEQTSIREATAAMRGAFQHIEVDLDTEAARSRLRRARDQLEPFGDTAASAMTYIGSCETQLTSLETAARGMAKVIGNQIEITEQGERTVDSFYLDPHECSRGLFIPFLTNSKNTGYDNLDPAVKKAWQSAKEFNWSTERLDKVIGMQDVTDQHPIDLINYYEAAAYAASLKKTLPTLAEWWLAARGHVGNSVAWPGGTEWSLRHRGRNLLPKTVPVDEGCLSHHFTRTTPSVHHLAGNVAEWLASEGGTYGNLVGGSVKDEKYRKDLQKIHAGEKLMAVKLGERMAANGFRCVLRPKSFFEGLGPR